MLRLDAFAPYLADEHRERWPELSAMTDFFVDFEERDDDYDWRAAWLALIDRTTGASLPREWLNQAQPYVAVRLP
ncbi:hypothetical protein [Herbidospora mongoliensis]|uniref:hypothetical protein n=1 Tax=Herbidospora mongoliensis TaxID=688067 RepID=UPI0012FBB6BC|nr:hypothetical protein [Herbidospora mongoliensis]